VTISNWPVAERPREKLLGRGADALSDAELLAIFLRVGVTGKSAVDLARELLIRCGSLSALCSASEREVCEIPGMGRAKYAQLQAVMEMARRALREKLANGNALSSPSAVRGFLRLKLQALPHEVFLCLYLDAQNRVIASEELFRGTLTQTSVYPREVVKRALHHNAGAAIFAHNHPFGCRRTQPRRRNADPGVETVARAGRRAGAGSLHSSRERGLVVRGTRPDLRRTCRRASGPRLPAHSRKRRDGRRYSSRSSRIRHPGLTRPD
jgi:DNA repair protein RadC